jgi:GNAT superfamily N-acetyltransferase
MQSAPITKPDVIVEHTRGEFLISTDPARLDLHTIHKLLATDSYWAKQIPFETFARSAENSLCFGGYDAAGAQVGFARVISDFATFAYIADVFVLDAHRRRGLGKLLMESIMQHPQLQGLRRWVLTTRDAHGLYAQFGFQSPQFPDRFMEILRPNLYAGSEQKKMPQKESQVKE